MTYSALKMGKDVGYELKSLQIPGSLCHPFKTPIETKYLLHDAMLDTVSSAKHLGVTISDDLLWSTHIDNACKSDSLLPKKKHPGP